MKALVTVNEVTATIKASDNEELLMLVKDELINDISDQMDAINEVLHDATRGNSDYTIDNLERQLEDLEEENSRICRASSISSLRNLGYDVEIS